MMAVIKVIVEIYAFIDIYSRKTLILCCSGRVIKWTLLLFIAVGTLYLTNNYGFRSSLKTISQPDENTGDLSIEKPLLINTTHCKIPNFLPWSKSANLIEKRCTPYFKNDPKCREKHLHPWTYVTGSYLNVNLTAVKKSGYSWNSIRCCYRIIIRVEQSLDNYTMKADRIIKYSRNCIPIKETRQFIDAEFIRVMCMSSSVPLLDDVVSRDFFAIAKADVKANEKIKQWKERKENGEVSPPNVIIFGVDTLSRLCAHRILTETLGVLRSIGAIEINGYTKVGQTTFPNTVAFMTGYSLSELSQHCYQTVRVAQDFCPYVWKTFEKLGYLTAEMEDVPKEGIFTYLKAGFVKKPTDFYIRPLMLAVTKMRRENDRYVKCIGGSTIEEVQLKYIRDILDLARPTGTPVFIHSWLGAVNHECSLGAKHSDSTFAKFLRDLDKNNTVIMFLADHGDVYGQFRETIQGWYEDKLPALWVYIPERLRRSHPEWMESLHSNSKRLTTHFDMYKTLVHIVQTFDKTNASQETYDRLSGQYGQTLFQPVPENRTCSDAGIPNTYCPCSEPKGVNVKDVKVQLAAKLALHHIIKMLPDECEIPVMTQVVEGKFFVTPINEHNVYIVKFATDPGHFLFEATVTEDKRGDFTVADDVLRVNKMERKANCIKIPILEKYCYCK